MPGLFLHVDVLGRSACAEATFPADSEVLMLLLHMDIRERSACAEVTFLPPTDGEVPVLLLQGDLGGRSACAEESFVLLLLLLFAAVGFESATLPLHELYP